MLADLNLTSEFYVLGFSVGIRGFELQTKLYMKKI